jgi:hypothetical protein
MKEGRSLVRRELVLHRGAILIVEIANGVKSLLTRRTPKRSLANPVNDQWVGSVGIW